MGSRFLMKKEAAQILGVSVITIYRMIARGELRPVRSRQFVGVLEEDVTALKHSRLKRDEERTLPFALNRQTILRHETEIRVLRRELDQVLRILNVRREHLKVTDLEMVTLYRTAEQYSKEGWPPQVEESWASYLLRLHTDNFHQIEKVTKDRHPWRPFLRFASTLQLRPYNSDLLIQLSAARDHVHSMAQVWFEIKVISPIHLDKMIHHDTKPSKRLLNVLERRQQKYAAKDSE